MDIKTIDKILWWIPSITIRNFIRNQYLRSINNDEQLRLHNEQLNLVNEKLNLIAAQNKILLIQSQQNYKLQYDIFSRKFIVLQICNGFTDQMLVYRIGYSISKIYGIKVKYDLSYYNQNTVRKFELLNVFKNLDFEIATDDEINIAKNMFYVDGRYGYDNNVIDYIINNNAILYINLHASFYIDINRIKFNEIFNLDANIFYRLDERNLSLYYKIISDNYSVACHIRRTDYLYVEYRNKALTDKYEHYLLCAIEEFNQLSQITIYFFSDDTKYVKEQFVPLYINNKYKYVIVDINNGKNDYFDFYLISKCKYQIASQGNFCQTAYEFNSFKDKRLITPYSINF